MFIGLICVDCVKYKYYVDFDFFEYIVDELKDVD